MKVEPEAGTGSGRPSGSSDTFLVDVPFTRFASDELERASGVVKRCFDRGLDAFSTAFLT